MIVFILLGVIIGCRLAGLVFFKKEYIPQQQKGPCKPHEWSYNQDDKLECLHCRFKAGLPYEED
jgi:hypothetical protein